MARRHRRPKEPEDEFEATIQDQIEEAADAADVILVVVDSTEHPGDEERTVAKKALKSKKPVILITNKADLKNALPDDEFKRLGIKDHHPHLRRAQQRHKRRLE